MITSEQLFADKAIFRLSDMEKKHYLRTLKEFYEDDEAACEDILINHPRWSIIAGYYAMHNVSKYLIGDKLSIKISSTKTHTSTIVLMQEYLRDEKIKKNILKLLEEAKKIFDDINKNDWNISKYLSVAQSEREKVNYYSSEFDKKEIAIKAVYFKEKIMGPYLHIIKELLKDDRDSK